MIKQREDEEADAKLEMDRHLFAHLLRTEHHQHAAGCRADHHEAILHLVEAGHFQGHAHCIYRLARNWYAHLYVLRLKPIRPKSAAEN